MDNRGNIGERGKIMAKLRFGAALVCACLTFIGGNAFATGTEFYIYILDYCQPNGHGGYTPAVLSGNTAAEYACNNSTACDTSTNTLYSEIPSGKRSDYSHGGDFFLCGAFDLMGPTGTDWGRYVGCVDNSVSQSSCWKYVNPIARGACVSDYIIEGTPKLRATNNSYSAWSAPGQDLVGVGEVQFSDAQIECCAICGKWYNDWTDNSNNNCQSRRGQKCSVLGVCEHPDISILTYVRCKANYYSAIGQEENSGVDACNDLQCTACPTKDSGWSGPVSPAGSISYTQCYESLRSGQLTCDEGELRRYGASASGYSSTNVEVEQLIADRDQYVVSDAVVPHCESCPNAKSSYTTSALSTRIPGQSIPDSTQSIPITACYLQAGTYYDAKGTFTLSSNCSYSTSATSNLL